MEGEHSPWQPSPLRAAYEERTQQELKEHTAAEKVLSRIDVQIREYLQSNRVPAEQQLVQDLLYLKLEDKNEEVATHVDEIVQNANLILESNNIHYVLAVQQDARYTPQEISIELIKL